MSKEITPRAQDYSQWYNDLVIKGSLADHSAVRGCMVIKPYGFALCAIVTHYRLKTDPNNKGKLIVDPEAKLEEELVVRPTSEAIIWNTYKGWIQSYRDLPILVNQWANVVRWEMRTRLFLRTAEFLWQEGHTAHATKAEAVEETTRMLDVYADFVENWMALPVIKGVKSANERFAGAEDTYCNKNNNLEYVWATSWGVSTRLIGALVMAHSDDQGLVLPPKIAPLQVVIVPIFKGDEQKAAIDVKVTVMMAELKALGVSVKYDDSDNARPGWKFAEYEMKGVPVRIAIGARDLEQNIVEVARRDTKEKANASIDGIGLHVKNLLDEIQQNIFNKAKAFRDDHITEANTWDEFVQLLDTKTGFISAHWDGTPETEEKIKEQTKATIRCIPLENKQEAGTCILSGNPSTQRVLFARAY